MRVHNGLTVRFWTDIWHPLDRLIEVSGEIGTQKLGIMREALISEVRSVSGWIFRRCRDTHMRAIVLAIETHSLDVDRMSPDVVLWRRREDEFGTDFNTTETWQQIRTRRQDVPWSKVVWFQYRVPRFAFITWLAIRNRLSTGDRMRSWGQIQGCLFCEEPNETRDHLFFVCPYTYMLWIEVVGTLLGRPPDPDWDETIGYLVQHSFDRLNYILFHLVFQTTVYMIWRERNDRRHQKKPRHASHLAHLIGRTVKNQIHSMNYSANPRLRGLMQRWFITHS